MGLVAEQQQVPLRPSGAWGLVPGMSSSTPVPLATARIAAVVFALSACGLLVYREHVRAQAPVSVVEESLPGGGFADEGIGEGDLGSADSAGDSGLPELQLLDGYASDYLFSSKSLPMAVLPLTVSSERDESYDLDELVAPVSPPTYFPSSKSAPSPLVLPLFPPVEKP